MKTLLSFLILCGACFADAVRVGESQPLKEAKRFLALSDQIIELSKIAEKVIREKYKISDQEDLELYSYSLYYGNQISPPTPEDHLSFSFNFGVKSSLGYITQRDGAFDWPDLWTYGMSYKATISPDEGIIRIIDFKEETKMKNQPNQTPEPTPTAVTPDADASVAPSAGAAHL